MIKEAILKLAQRNDLTAEEALEVMNEIMDGKASPVQMSSYLTALSLKGENIEEITGSAKGMRDHCIRLLHEMDVLENTDETLYLDFHYCPLVKAWQKAGCSDEEIAQLCDIAMCGDHGIGARFDSVLELPKCIAKGDDVCALRYKKAAEKKTEDKKL